MEYDGTILDEENEEDTSRMDETHESLLVNASPSDQLERCGGWLSSIPRDDVTVLRQTQEYQEFLQAFERLGHAHRKVISMNRSSMSIDDIGSELVMENIQNLNRDPPGRSPHHHHLRQQPQQQQIPLQLSTMSCSNNFLQHLTADDVILRILEFLECQSLIRTAMTCSRFRQLAYRSATQRTYDVANARQLNNVMQLLRAKEQIDGVGTGIHDSHVRVPILLLSRRVLVTDAGDPEYNGVYFCTGSNGNGFVFTKPRFPEQRVHRSQGGRYVQRSASGLSLAGPLPAQELAGAEANAARFQGTTGQGGGMATGGEAAPTARFESEVAQPGQLLRCIIAKRFSNETILWYLSKEVESSDTQDGLSSSEVTQVFAFWAKLMVIGDASPDICRYPSQSSILSRHNEGWQALSTTRTTRPPTVELLD